jgi:hypothetical protein
MPASLVVLAAFVGDARLPSGDAVAARDGSRRVAVGCDSQDVAMPLVSQLGRGSATAKAPSPVELAPITARLLSENGVTLYFRLL